MKRRPFISIIATLLSWGVKVFGFSKPPFEVRFPIGGNREFDMEMLGKLDQEFTHRRQIQVIRRASISKFGEPILIFKYRVAMSNDVTPSRKIPEFNSIAEAEVWGGVKPAPIDPRSITTMHPVVPMPVYPEPPDLSTLPRYIPSPEQMVANGWEQIKPQPFQPD